MSDLLQKPESGSPGETAQAKREDREDIEKAQAEGGGATPQGQAKPWWRSIGAGLITGAADDDPSGIGTYSVAGAQFGTGLLWLVPFCIPLMIGVQEMCGRIGVVTGKGLAAAIKEHYPKWMLIGAIALLIGANITNIYADLNVMAASAQMLFHGPFLLWLTLMAAGIILLQVFVPYCYYVRWLKWLCLALLGYVVTAFLPAVHIDWRQTALSAFVPHWINSAAFVLTAVGFLGTTISPYLFFWQASEEVEDYIADGKIDQPGQRVKKVGEKDLKSLRADTAVGMIASQAVTFFIMICTAATLHTSGGADINTAQDAARAMRPLGQAAYWLFALGILGTGSLAIPTLAGSVGYAVAEACDWRYGLYRRFRRARKFYAVIAGAVVLGYLLNFVHSFSPVKALLYSAVINGVFAPPLIIMLLLVCNNVKIFGKRRNGPWSNGIGWLTVACMGTAAVVMLWSMVTGKAG